VSSGNYRDKETGDWKAGAAFMPHDKMQKLGKLAGRAEAWIAHR
jgi:hypothetical protein